MPRQVDIVPLEENWNTVMESGLPYNFGRGETPNPYLQAHNTNARERNRLYGNVSLDLKLAGSFKVSELDADYHHLNQKMQLIHWDGETAFYGRFSQMVDGW